MFLSFLPCPELNFHSKHPFATHKTCPSLVLPVVSVAHLQHIRHRLFTHTLNERWDCSRMLANSDSWFESVLLQLWELWDWLWHHQVQQVLVHAHRTKFPWAHRTHRTYWTVDSGELPQPCMISTTKTIMTNWCVTRTAGSSTFSYVQDWKLEKQQTASHDSHWDNQENVVIELVSLSPTSSKLIIPSQRPAKVPILQNRSSSRRIASDQFLSRNSRCQMVLGWHIRIPNQYLLIPQPRKPWSSVLRAL